jgi:epoxide hydrolase-like predicted phosphatase
VPLSSVKNLIFDLGGVILDLSVDHTLESFSKISGIDKNRVKQIFISSPEFELYEKGEIDDATFRDFIRSIYEVEAADDQIDSSWNAMLRGLPVGKLDLLQALKKDYNVYLLSNTNGIHLTFINETILRDVTGETNLDLYFHKAYYSHRMKKRKPDAQIFQQVLEENNLKANETLFLDDNPHNIAGADALGIRTVYVTSPDIVFDVFRS